MKRESLFFLNMYKLVLVATFSEYIIQILNPKLTSINECSIISTQLVK